MLRYGWKKDAPFVEDVEPPTPVYCILTECEVSGHAIELRHVDESGRARASVLDRDGAPVTIPVDTHHHDMGDYFPGPGRFAVIARDARGRIEARNDYYVRSQGDRPRTPSPAEALRDERDAERAARRTAEAAARSAEARCSEIEARFSMANQRAEVLSVKLDRFMAQHEEVLIREQRRRQAAEEALAELRRRAMQAGAVESFDRIVGVLAKHFVPDGEGADE